MRKLIAGTFLAGTIIAAAAGTAAADPSGVNGHNCEGYMASHGPGPVEPYGRTWVRWDGQEQLKDNIVGANCFADSGNNP